MEYPQNYYTGAVVARTSQTMKRVYVKMTLALIVTAFVSMWCAGSQAFISFVFAIYVLLQTKALSRQCKKVLYAFLPKAFCDKA
ncbi:MAG: hypothetical protein J6J61_04980, partial [Muribaculaceae bacterium]|nr:hypothetical protein [Muribaculaceae bacterium]